MATATGFGTLYSSQTAWGTPVLNYKKQVYLAMAAPYGRGQPADPASVR